MATAKKPEEIGIQGDKDLEIQRLKDELEKANARASYRTPAEEQQRLQQLAAELAEENADPWRTNVDVRVPRRSRTEDPWYWINIGGRSIQIPADDQVQEMKLPFALILMDMLMAEENTQSYVDNRVKVFDPVKNPHPEG